MASYVLNLLKHRPLVSVCVLWFVTLFTVLYVFKEGMLCEELVDSLSQRGE